jgi:hypothetical protein
MSSTESKEVFLMSKSLKESTYSSGDSNLFEVLLEVCLLVVPAVIGLVFAGILRVLLYR